MKSKAKPFLILLVAGTIAFSIGIIIVSLFANRQHWDRDTAFAAARYDAVAILALIDEAPARAVDYPEMEEGPIAPDLREVGEAWVAWRQLFESGDGFASIVAWHRANLPAEWVVEERPDEAVFRRGEWSLMLKARPDSPTPRYQRILQWTRDPDVL